ncbi:MAG TPA: flagellar hook capping FlgD N-terminal domain-containing protein [Terriglobales bacterium]|nr:flagellar hook capping FlgD N-terminal domain-containing protein [Terriglobales bacterium]
MQINPLTTVGVVANASSTPSVSNSTGGSNSTDDTQSMFMKLLTAQLENQTPLDPVDPMQFTQELVQFNMLDQLTQINNTMQQLSGAPASSSQPNGNASAPIQGGN